MSESDNKKVEPKMVRESDLIAVKKREDALKQTLAEIKEQLAQAQSELKVAKMNADDSEEVAEVKKFLVEEEKRVNGLLAEVEKRETSVAEREAESRVKELAAEFEVDVEQLRDCDNPKERALELRLERLAKEKDETPPPAENVFEVGGAGLAKKSISQMDDKEFAELEAQLKARSLSNK